MPPVAIGLGAAGLASGLAGAYAQNESSKRAAALSQQGINAFKNLQLPDINDERLDLEKLKAVGSLSPELQSTVLQGESGLNNVSTDPRLRQAQMDALDTLQRIGASNGLDAQSQADLEGARIKTESEAKGARDAVLQNAAARGISGSGLELAASMQADQGAADRNALAGTQAAADASKRKMDALNAMAVQSGNVRSQDYGEASKAAEAQDAINRFNTQNSQAVQGANVGAKNAAQEYNLTNQQNIANQNVGLGNAQQQFNKGLIQQGFDNNYKVAQGVAGQTANAANAESAAGSNLAKTLGGIGQTAIGTGATLYANQPKKNPLDQTY